MDTALSERSVKGLIDKVICKALACQSVSALFDQGVVSVASFLSGVIIGRKCSKDEFGLYILGMSIVMMVTELQNAIISMPYMVYFPKLERDEQIAYTGSILFHQLALSLLLSLIFIGGYIAVSAGLGPQGLESVLLALAAFGIFIFFRDSIRRILFSHLMMQKALLFDVLVSTIQLGIILSMAQMNLLTPYVVFCIVGVACGIAVLRWFLVEKNNYSFSPRRVLIDLGKNWSFGKWILASGGVWSVSMQIYPWLLTTFHGTSSAGVWAACIGLIALANPILLGAQNYLGPRIAYVAAENKVTSFRRFVFRAGTSIFLILAPFVAILMIYANEMLVLIYGDKYSGNGNTAALLGVNLCTSALIFPFSRALFAIEKADIDFKVNILAVGIIFTVGLWLVKVKGPVGAALAVLLTNVITSVVRWIALESQLKKLEA